MKKRFERAAVVLVVVFVAAQFVRPEPANSTTDPNQSIQAQAGTASGLVADEPGPRETRHLPGRPARPGRSFQSPSHPSSSTPRPVPS